MRYAGKHVNVDGSAPRAQGTCDRCGFWYQIGELQWQMQWAGPVMINTRLLVCCKCLDEPTDQLRTITLPPDPPSILNARPEAYAFDEVDYRITEDGSYLVVEGGEVFILTEDGFNILTEDGFNILNEDSDDVNSTRVKESTGSEDYTGSTE